MHKYHKELLAELEKITEKSTSQGSHYRGTDKYSYQISNVIHRRIVKEWLKDHKDLTLEKYTDLLDSLFSAKTHEEFTFGSRLLEYVPRLRKELDINKLDEWLDHAVGWAEIDSICQSAFTADELLNDWDKWSKLLKKFLRSKQIAERRASIVLLTKPVGQSTDPRLSQMSFENIEELKHEKDILITKAVSWLLRSMVKNYRQEVIDYLEKNESSLPNVAVRETWRKIKTGRK